jgi:hypothetical protein
MKFFLIIINITIILNISIKNVVDKRDERPVPAVHVYMEHPDRDPLELKKKIEEEARENKRIENIKSLEQEDKDNFESIITQQNELLGSLSTLSYKSEYLLNTMNNNPNHPLVFKKKIIEEAYKNRRIENIKSLEQEGKDNFASIITQQNELLGSLSTLSNKSEYLLNTMNNNHIDQFELYQPRKDSNWKLYDNIFGKGCKHKSKIG